MSGHAHEVVPFHVAVDEGSRMPVPPKLVKGVVEFPVALGSFQKAQIATRQICQEATARPVEKERRGQRSIAQLERRWPIVHQSEHSSGRPRLARGEAPAAEIRIVEALCIGCQIQDKDHPIGVKVHARGQVPGQTVAVPRQGPKDSGLMGQRVHGLGILRLLDEEGRTHAGDDLEVSVSTFRRHDANVAAHDRIRRQQATAQEVLDDPSFVE